MISRRNALKLLGTIPAGYYLQSILACSNEKEFQRQLGASLYKSTGTNIPQITQNLLESLGGIQSLIDKDDIVVLKPNAQWWLQGMTNTDVMSEFITQVLSIPGFKGEIIIADNHQDKVPDSRGWNTDQPNGKFNYNDLVRYFNGSGFPNVTKYHWTPAGPNPTPLMLQGSGDSVVTHPSEGDGYIWPKDLFYECPYGNKCLLSYPVFTSSYSGVTIDLKDGAFKDGSYTGQPIKFINFSAINHHGRYTGVTASIKNFMGVVDMTCGYPSPNPDGHFNTHHIGASYIFRLLADRQKTLQDVPFYWDARYHPSVFRFKYTGGVLGKFMKTIRSADLNIITAINIGWGSRTDTAMAANTNTVLASTDPVALDYWAAANVLLPATKKAGAAESYIELNDPNIEDGPMRKFLEECRRELGGTIEPELISIIES